MSDITINNNGSQDKNQKTTPVKKSFSEFTLLNDIPTNAISHIWLELGYGNITFSDELDFDVAELDIVYEDSDEGASIL